MREKLYVHRHNQVFYLKAPSFDLQQVCSISCKLQYLIFSIMSGLSLINELEKDFIAVVRFQGPQAIGMPELHKLTPYLGVLQDKGFKVALVTDGRMSGASGKVPAAIHVYPEAEQGGPIAKLREGDLVRLNAETGELIALLDENEWQQRTAIEVDLAHSHQGMGRELFGQMRAFAGGAEQGASVFGFANEENK